jgi:hypothetical protein
MAVASPAFSSFSIIKSALVVPFYIGVLPVFLLTAHHLFMMYLVKIFDHLGKILSYFNIDVIKEKYFSG